MSVSKIEELFKKICESDNEKEFFELIKKFNNVDVVLKVVNLCINYKSVNCTARLLDTLPNYSKHVDKKVESLLSNDKITFLNKVNKRLKELQAYRYRPVDKRKIKV